MFCTCSEVDDCSGQVKFTFTFTATNENEGAHAENDPKRHATTMQTN